MAVIEATSENFDELIQSAEYAMVDFYGDHCGACVATAPYFRDVADDMAFIKFIQVNTSVHRDLAKRFRIMGIPTFQYYENGKIVNKSDGGMDTTLIYERLAEMLYHD